MNKIKFKTFSFLLIFAIVFLASTYIKNKCLIIKNENKIIQNQHKLDSIQLTLISNEHNS